MLKKPSAILQGSSRINAAQINFHFLVKHKVWNWKSNSDQNPILMRELKGIYKV